MKVYTLIFEFNGITGWQGSVRQMPDLKQVRGNELEQVQYQLAGQLVDRLWTLANGHHVCITTESKPNPLTASNRWKRG